MKLNISYPANGSQKIIEVDDERKLRGFMEKRMGTEVSTPRKSSITDAHTTQHTTHTSRMTRMNGLMGFYD